MSSPPCCSYGDEITATSNDREKFGTYTRDSYTGLDYADQRWFTSTYGRFNTADPYQASGGPSDPGSWNRYSYVEGDPVNGYDPRGLIVMDPGIDYGGAGPCDYLDPEIDFFSCGPGGPSYHGAYSYAPVRGSVNDDSGGGAAPDQPSCSISLDERPVPNSASPSFHAYLTVTDSAWSNDPNGLLLEGGPSGNFVASKLVGYDTQAPGAGLGAGTPNASDPSLPSNKQIGSTYAGSLACGAVQYLIGRVEAYKSGPQATYNFLAVPGTYNSNSFASTLVNDLNSIAYGSILGAFGPVVPGGVPGWGKLVPGL